MALTLVRHTRPRELGFCYGRSEVDLAASFADEAEALLPRLGPTARLVSSPLKRCLRLAEFLGARLGVPVTVDARWREMDFGDWEGRPWNAIPRAKLDTWAADFMHARPHGGESVATLLDRTRCAVEDYLATGDRCAVVTHAGSIRAALFAAGDAAAWNRFVPFAEPLAFGSAGDGGAAHSQ